MAENIQLPGFSIPVGMDLKTLDRQAKSDLRQRVQKIGKEAAEEFIEAQQNQLRARRADVNEAFFRGMIDPKEARKRAQEASREFVQAMLKEIEQRAKSGKLSDAAFVELTEAAEKEGARAGMDFSAGAQEGLGALPRWVRGAFAGGIIAGVAYITSRMVGMFRDAAQGIRDVLSKAGDAQEIRRGFENVSIASGLDPNGAIAQVRKGLRGVVSEIEAMRLAQQAMQAELPVTEANLGRLAFMTRRLAEASGKDAPESFDRLVNGLAKMETEILEQLGLTTTLQSAQADWERQTGRNADSLTRSQSIGVLFNAVMEEMERKTARLGRETFNAKRPVEQLAAAWEDLKDKTAVAVAESPRIVSFLEGIGASAEGAGNRIDDVAMKIGALVDTLAELAPENEDGFLSNLFRPGIWGPGPAMEGLKDLVRPRFEENLARRREERARSDRLLELRSLKDISEIRRELFENLQREQELRSAGTIDTQAMNRLLEERRAIVESLNRASAPSPEEPEDPKEAKKRAEERLKIQKELNDRLFALNATTAEAAIREIDRLGEAYVAAGGRLEDIVGKLDALKQRITEGGALQTLREEFDGLRRDSLDMGDLPEINAFIERAAAERDALAETNPLREEYNALIGQAIRLTGELEKAAKKAAEEEVKHAKKVRDFWRKADAQVAREQEDRLRNLRDQARTIEENVRAALQLAEAFGMIDDEAARALETVGQLAAAVVRIASGDISAVPSALGASATLITMITDNPEAERQREAMIQLTDAIHRLRETMVSDVSGGRVRQLEDSLQWLLGGNVREVAEGGQIFRALKEIEELLGLQAGTLVSDSGKVASKDVLREALRALQEMEFGAFGDDVSGRLSAFNFLMSQLGDAAGSAADRLDMLLEMLSGMGAGSFLGEFEKRLRDGGPEAANAFLDEIAARLAAGDQSLFGPGGLFEFMTAEEARQLLEQLNQSVDDILTGGGGSTRDFVRTSVIREVTANRLEGLLHTGNHYLSLIAAHTAAMAGVRFDPSAAIPAPAAAGVGGGGMVVHMTFGNLVGEVNVGGAGAAGATRAEVLDALETARLRFEETVPEVLRRTLYEERSARGRDPRTGK